jgi:hypothetical protein
VPVPSSVPSVVAPSVVGSSVVAGSVASPPGGSEPEQFEDFCAQNPGAC